jgi:mannosyltransferase
VTLDDIIFRLQQFGGASDYWRALTEHLSEIADLEVDHRAGHSWSRVLPVVTSSAVLHSSHFRVPARRSVGCVTTIHDLAFERGLVSGRAARLNLWERSNAVRKADAIICISDNTRREMLEVYDGQFRADVEIRVVHHGRTYPQPTGSPRPEWVPQHVPYVLHVGNRAGYKNFENGLRGFARSRLSHDGVELWCTGAPLSPDERRLVEQYRLGRSVRSLGTVATDDLGRLYEHAAALLYPSRYEGFGLPPLDAMALGCPVVAGNRTSVPEIVGDAGLLVDPDDVDGFAAALRRVVEPDQRERLVRAGLERATTFSWIENARQHAAVYRSLASR